MPEVAGAWLQGGPRKVSARIIKRRSHRLEELFEAFWDDQDFLLIEEFQDLPPDPARQIKDMLRLPDEVIEPMYAALERWYVSPNVAENLVGLLTDAEIVGDAPAQGRRSTTFQRRRDGCPIVTGVCLPSARRQRCGLPHLREVPCVVRCWTHGGQDDRPRSLANSIRKADAVKTVQNPVSN
jgi:hypothetical protein